MTPREIAEEFIRSWEHQDFMVLEKLVTDDFQLTGATPHPLNKRWLIADTKARWAAFPDWKFNARIVEETGDSVKLITNITATHTGTLIAPFPDIPPIPPTGIVIRQPEEQTILRVRNNQVVEWKVVPLPNGGYPGILKQLGVEIPDDDD